IVPIPINSQLVQSTNSRALLFDTSQLSRPPKKPSVEPPIPPIHPADRSDHQGFVVPIATSPPGYSTNSIGPINTLPVPGRIKLISRRFGGVAEPARLKGSRKGLGAEVPLI